MSRLSALLAALCIGLVPAFASAQAPAPQEDYSTMNLKAVLALRAKQFDDGIAILARMLEIWVKDKGAAYNLACAHSLKGEVDKAFEWIDRSIEWGWGSGKGNLDGSAQPMDEIEMAKVDPDLKSLRTDPRFEALVTKMATAKAAREALVKKAEAYAAAPAIYVPEKVAELTEMPLLVVLHESGSNKDKIVPGAAPAAAAVEGAGAVSDRTARPASVDWKSVADELGFALVAASGKFLVADDPAQGMAWWDDPNEYLKKSWQYEKTVNDAVTAFKKDHKLDKARVFVCGEGVGGMVAINAAISSPGLYKGAVALGGQIVPTLMSQKAPTAGKMGLKVKLLLDAGAMRKANADAGKDAAEVEKTIAAWGKSLEGWGIQGGVAGYERDPMDPTQARKIVVEALKSLMPSATATPIETGAPPPPPPSPLPPGAPPK